jgi:hypothetical protein
LEFALIDELVKTKEFEWGKGEDLDVHYELFLSFGFLAPGENSLSIFDRVSPREGFVFELLAIHGSPGKFPRSWPAAKALHEIVGPATHRCGPSRTLSGSGVEMSVVDIFTFLNSRF